jgi:hypothetical protein
MIILVTKNPSIYYLAVEVQALIGLSELSDNLFVALIIDI